MPMSANQMAALVERAKLKAPPVINSPPPSNRKESRYPPKPPEPIEPPAQPTPATPLLRQHPEAAAAEATAPDDFPTGWELRKESWHFHRRFHAVFKRPMEHGEYSHLLWQIRRGAAEQLDADCWRVTLPGGRTLPVRATAWRLITILPKNWQPLQSDAPSEASRLNSANGNSDLPPGGGQLLGCDA